MGKRFPSSSSFLKRMGFRGKALFLVLGGGTCFGTFAYGEELMSITGSGRVQNHRVDDLRNTFSGFLRASRTTWNAILVMADYKLTLRRYDAHSPEYAEALQRIHTRAANRILALCKRNGGVYNKLGQYAATMTRVLPAQYTDALKQLQDRAQCCDWEIIKQVILEDLGPPEDLFGEFDCIPLASASLAQVHRAVRKRDGQEVAVKLQYPHLRQQMKGDFLILKVFLYLLGRFFPDFEFSWIFPEMEMNLRNELDFRQEAYNSIRIARMLKHRKDVIVPWIDWDTTTDRVLTMEFIRGTKVTDVEELQKKSIKRENVAKILQEVFAEMLFYHGFVHCDPHPGNLLVVKAEDDKTKLVLLDHGMYRRLNPTFRQNFCRLWKALVLQDNKLGADASYSLKIDKDGYYGLSLILTHRFPSSKLTMLGGSTHSLDRKQISEMVAQQSPAVVSLWLQKLPRDVLWIFRGENIDAVAFSLCVSALRSFKEMLNIVRSINYELNGTSMQTFKAMARRSVDGVHLLNNGLSEVSREAALLHPEYFLSEEFKVPENLSDDFKLAFSSPGAEDEPRRLLSYIHRNNTNSTPFFEYGLPGDVLLNLPVASEYPIFAAEVFGLNAAVYPARSPPSNSSSFLKVSTSSQPQAPVDLKQPAPSTAGNLPRRESADLSKSEQKPHDEQSSALSPLLRWHKLVTQWFPLLCGSFSTQIGMTKTLPHLRSDEDTTAILDGSSSRSDSAHEAALQPHFSPYQQNQEIRTDKNRNNHNFKPLNSIKNNQNKALNRQVESTLSDNISARESSGSINSSANSSKGVPQIFNLEKEGVFLFGDASKKEVEQIAYAYLADPPRDRRDPRTARYRIDAEQLQGDAVEAPCNLSTVCNSRSGSSRRRSLLLQSVHGDDSEEGSLHHESTVGEIPSSVTSEANKAGPAYWGRRRYGKARDASTSYNNRFEQEFSLRLSSRFEPFFLVAYGWLLWSEYTDLELRLHISRLILKLYLWYFMGV